jgi:hypothetical protein
MQWTPLACSARPRVGGPQNQQLIGVTPVLLRIPEQEILHLVAYSWRCPDPGITWPCASAAWSQDPEHRLSTPPQLPRGPLRVASLPLPLQVLLYNIRHGPNSSSCLGKPAACMPTVVGIGPCCRL